MREESARPRAIALIKTPLHVYYIKLNLTFDDKPINIPTSDEIENMANSSDIQSNVSPTKRKHRCNRNGVSFLLKIYHRIELLKPKV